MFVTAALFAADPPKPQPKQASLEDANVILQMRNIRTQLHLQITQMDAQIQARESAIREKLGIPASCQLDQSGRNFVLIKNEGGKDVTYPCPEATPSIPKEEPKK